jgi:hypothetical protein
MDIVNWVFLAVMAGLIVGWLIALCLDPEAFQSGAKR